MTGCILPPAQAAEAVITENKVNKTGSNAMRTVRKLIQKEHGKTKPLYERIFNEDTQAFTDYYYQYKATENQIYVVEQSESGDIISMLHLNPYQVRLGSSVYKVHYIVAVATREGYRHQGLMRTLLVNTLKDMYNEGEPFTFLMPAAEEIYLPFDFRFIYNQNQMDLFPEEYRGEPELEFYCAWTEDVMDLVRFADKTLPEQYGVYAVHSEEYFYKQLFEQECQGGSIVIILEQGQVKGYFLTAEESTPEIREAVIAKGYETQLFPIIGKCFRGCEKVKLKGFPVTLESKSTRQVPVIMARIVHLEHFMECLTAKEPVELRLHISDSLIKENTGDYVFRADWQGAKLCRLEKDMEFDLAAAQMNEQDVRITIAQLAELAFGYRTPEQMNLPLRFTREWKKINLFQTVFINEIV